MAVVSNKPDAAVKELCRQYFPGIYALGETADCPRKPAPDMVHKAMAAIGVERCVYVGDSEVDILTADHAGVPCLSVLWGFRDEDVLREAGGSAFCHDPAELPAILRTMK
jgi:phosphoglycolate phosphatase